MSCLDNASTHFSDYSLARCSIQMCNHTIRSDCLYQHLQSHGGMNIFLTYFGGVLGIPTARNIYYEMLAERVVYGCGYLCPSICLSYVQPQKLETHLLLGKPYVSFSTAPHLSTVNVSSTRVRHGHTCMHARVHVCVCARAYMACHFHTPDYSLQLIICGSIIP